MNRQLCVCVCFPAEGQVQFIYNAQNQKYVPVSCIDLNAVVLMSLTGKSEQADRKNKIIKNKIEVIVWLVVFSITRTKIMRRKFVYYQIKKVIPQYCYNQTEHKPCPHCHCNRSEHSHCTHCYYILLDMMDN